MKQDNGQAFITEWNGAPAILICVPLENLPAVVDGAWLSRTFHTRYKVTDVPEFAADLVRALNDESETGTTPIHRLFDRAILDAIDGGAFGIEDHEDQGDATVKPELTGGDATEARDAN